MFARAGSIGVFVIAAGFVLAGDGSPYEKILEKTVATLGAITAELAKITDEESAAAAKPELKKAAVTWAETQMQAKKLQPPEKAEKVRLEKKYKRKLDEAVKKLLSQKVRVEAIPGGKDALREIRNVLKTNGK